MNRRTLLLLLSFVACFHEEESFLGDGSTTTGAPPSGTSSSSTPLVEDSSTTMDPDTSTSAHGGEGDSSTTEVDPDTSSSDSSSTGTPITDWALYFGGSASMQSTEDVDLDLDGDFTVEAWIRVDSPDATGSLIEHRGVGTTGWSLVLSETSSRFVFGFFDNNGAWHQITGTDAADLDPGWHHVAGTKHGMSMYLHVDGSVAATGACALAMSAPVVPVVVGTHADDDNLTFIVIDDLRVSTGARYLGAFVPDDDLVEDPTTLILVVADESDGTAAFDTGPSALTFDLQGTAWVPGNTAT